MELRIQTILLLKNKQTILEDSPGVSSIWDAETRDLLGSRPARSHRVPG